MKRLWYLVVGAWMATAATFAQEMAPLPLDPSVRYGKLDNGLTYYICHSEQPKERCEFHIAQAVGAILEEDHQNGLAHFLEHMAFNGTEHFPGKGIINYFESIGVNFGGNINAYTSVDETVYRLSDVPTYREGIIDSALLVMHDWSCALSLLGEEIDAERGVIREEWRTGATAARRMHKEQMSEIFPGSQYAKRDVIGDTAVINNFSYQALRDYYHKWYGPDLQAIIVVGDIDVDEMEAKIKALWKDVPARKNRGERPIYTVDNNVEPIVSIVTDKEASSTRLEVMFKHDVLPAEAKASIVGFSQEVMSELIYIVMSNRLEEITKRSDAPLVASFLGYTDLIKSKDAFMGIVIPKEGKEKEAYMTLLTEIEKMRRYGFTNSELEIAKATLQKEYEQDYNERNNRKNIAIARECIRHYLDGGTMPGKEVEYELIKMLLPQVTTEALGTLAKAYVTDENVILTASGPIKEGVQMPTEAEMVAMLAQAKQQEIAAPKEEAVTKKLVKKSPKAAKIVKETQNAELGITEWTLSNGVRVVLKPTTFKQDEILFSAFSADGLVTLPTEKLLNGYYASTVVENNGVANFSSVELNKVLAGKSVDLSLSLSYLLKSMEGSSSVSDFETLLQLVHLYITKPRKDKDAFAGLSSRLETMLLNKYANPKAVFADSVQLTEYDHNPRVKAMMANVESVKMLDQKQALKIYKQYFSNAADFLFTFTGNIDPADESTRTLICTWLGSLKTKESKVDAIDVDDRVRPKGVVKNHFERNMQIRTASNRVLYSGAMEYTLTNWLNMQAVGQVLSTRYLESIREKEGGSYGVSCYGSIHPVQHTAYLIMQYDTDPDKQEKLLSIIHQEVDQIVKEGPRADDLQKVKESMVKDFAEDLESNNWWSDYALYYYYMYGINYVADYVKAVELLTQESVQATLTKLVEQGNMTEVVMMPTAE